MTINIIEYNYPHKALYTYKNGNGLVFIYNDGSRVIKYEGDSFEPDFPLNIDIRVSSKCSFGMNPKGKAVCYFCHESARTDGEVGDYYWIINKLKESNIPSGVELAIGANHIDSAFIEFLIDCRRNGWITNVTVNHGHIARDLENIQFVIDNNLIFGLGVSYRSSFSNRYIELISGYKNCVAHVIIGIDSIKDIMELKGYGVNKILVLGEKDFGFNAAKVNTDSKLHKDWRENVYSLLDVFDVVSFDNLALEQLNIRDRLSDKDWAVFYQGEHSMYLNAVTKTFSRSSRDSQIYAATGTISTFFKEVCCST